MSFRVLACVATDPIKSGIAQIAVDYDYDVFGNRYQKQSHNSGNPFTQIWTEDSDITQATNRFASNVTYDDAGNILTDQKFRQLKILKQISRSGLRSELDTAAMTRLAAIMPHVLKEWSKPLGCGVIYLILLDDERLPILDGPTQIEVTCKALGRDIR